MGKPYLASDNGGGVGPDREKGCMCCEMDRAFEEVSSARYSGGHDESRRIELMSILVSQRNQIAFRTGDYAVLDVACECRAGGVWAAR